MTQNSWVPACGRGWRWKSRTPLKCFFFRYLTNHVLEQLIPFMAGFHSSASDTSTRGQNLGHLRIFSPFMESFVFEQHVPFRADSLSVTSDLRFHDSAGSVASFSYLKYRENFKNLLVWNLNALLRALILSSGSLPSLFKMTPSWGWHDLHITSWGL